MEITQEVNDELMAACAAWLEMAIRELRNSAQKNKLNLTGDAINSIQGAISGFGGDGVDCCELLSIVFFDRALANKRRIRHRPVWQNDPFQ